MSGTFFLFFNQLFTALSNLYVKANVKFKGLLVSCMVRGLFRPVPYLALPLYRNSARGTGPKPKTPIYTEDNK